MRCEDNLISRPIEVLGGMDAETFLRDYWQKAPLLIRQAIPDVGKPVDLDWLSELASRDDVESRLVEYRQGQWKVEHGPLSSHRLARLPESDWTLLVQAVDQFVPEVAELLENFRFLPSWRIDDVMISYAAPGGSVTVFVKRAVTALPAYALPYWSCLMTVRVSVPSLLLAASASRLPVPPSAPLGASVSGSA